MTTWQKWLEGAVFAISGGAVTGATAAYANGESDPRKIRNAAVAGAGVIVAGLLRQWRPDLFTETKVQQSVQTTPTTTKTVDTTTVTTSPVDPHVP